MNIDIIKILTSPVFIFVFTCFFSLVPRYLKKTKISAYAKCLTGGVILSIMIFHIFIDLYEDAEFNNWAKFSSGLSFLLLFCIDKLYIEIQSRNNQCDTLPTNINKLQALVFVFAMSIHSFFEGTSILVCENRKKYYLFCLLGHKWIEAFTLGMSIEYSPFSRLIKIFLIVLYSSLTPIGEVTGQVLLNIFEENKIVKNLLVGVSCGSFFYIGFIDMLNSEFNKRDTLKIRLKKVMVIFFGFITMSTFFVFLPKE